MSQVIAEIFEAGGFPVVAGIVASIVTMIIILTSLTKAPVAMKPDDFQNFKLKKRVELNHDTRLYTFALQTPTTVLGLPIGQHITLRFKDKDGKNVQRSYTPVTGDETLGEVTFIIKVYRANVHPKFPNGGKMSQHLDSLKIGEAIEMKGPKGESTLTTFVHFVSKMESHVTKIVNETGHLTYLGSGKFTVKQMRKPLQERKAKHFGFIAGGTGITPVMQVVKAIFRETKDTSTTMSVLYANQSKFLNDVLRLASLGNLKI